MKFKDLSHFGVVALAGVAMLFSGSLFAEYPDKPVRVIVPFGTGGGTDIQARLLTEKMRESTGQQFIVDNRTGAGGLIGGQAAAEADPDGYTLLFSTATLAVNTTLYGKRMKFSVTKDLVPVYPGFESDNWYAMFFPKGVSKDKIMKINAEVGKALKDKLVAEFYAREGIDPVGGSPEELSALVKKEIVKYAGIIKKGSIKLK